MQGELPLTQQVALPILTPGIKGDGHLTKHTTFYAL